MQTVSCHDDLTAAGHGNQRTLQVPRHVFHEAGLAAAGWALEQHGNVVGVGRLEKFDLVSLGRVIGFAVDQVFVDVVLVGHIG